MANRLGIALTVDTPSQPSHMTTTHATSTAAHPAEGELIARRLKTHADAIESLRLRPPTGLALMFAAQAAGGAAAAWLVSRSTGEPVSIMASVAGAGLLLAVAACMQCVRMQRRQQAIITLLLAAEEAGSQCGAPLPRGADGRFGLLAKPGEPARSLGEQQP